MSLNPEQEATEGDASCSERGVEFIGPMQEVDAHSWFDGSDGFEYALDALAFAMAESIEDDISPMDGINKWVVKETRAAERYGVRLCPEATLKWAVERGIYHIAHGYDMCRTSHRWLAASVIETIDAHSPAIAEARALAQVEVEPVWSLAADVAWDFDFEYAVLRVGDARAMAQFDEMVALLHNKMRLRSEVCGAPEMSADLPHVANISLVDWQGNILRRVTMSWYQADDDVEEVPVKEDTDTQGAK